MSEKEEKKLYKVTSINQETGGSMVTYVTARNLLEVEREFADIIKVEPLGPYYDVDEGYNP